MMPESHNRYFPRAMVPNEALCRIVTSFLVAEYVKGKMTRECNFGQVSFNIKRCEDADNLLMSQQIQDRIPHDVCEAFTRARRGRGTRSRAFHCLTCGATRYSTRRRKSSAEKGAESKPTVAQCVRERHTEPDEEHITNSRPEVTMLPSVLMLRNFPRLH